MVFQAKQGVDVEKTVTDTQFKIATNSKLFSILSDSIYTRKIDAVIRELCCNAFDAQVEARQTRPFQITLPDTFAPEFRVRDFGSGLSDADMQMYTTYGESTKSGSNAYIGAFGIGAKSPFAYTNTFNVTSYHNGMARSYSMFVEQGVPRMTKLGEVPSDEPTGLDVFFSVASKDIDEFKERAIGICALMADKLEVLNVPDVWREMFRVELVKYNWKQAPYIGNGYMTSELEVDISCKQDVLNIIQGNVAYEMHLHEITEMLKYSLGVEYTRMVNQVNANFYIVGTLKVPNGTFVPHPSRERLTFDELTKASIKNIFEKIYKYYVIDSVDRVMDGVMSYYELHNRLKGYPKLVTGNPKITDFACPPRPGYMLDTMVIPIRNYGEWKKREFRCHQIVGNGENGNYRFRGVFQMTMTGELIERIYYSAKYPLAGDYRYRIIHDKQQAEIKKAILLSGKISQMFSSEDRATFVDVQNLPKLTPQELAAFKKNVAIQTGKNDRVTKEEVSYLVVDSSSGSNSIRLSQRTSNEVVDFAAKYPVYWVASNRRYEIELGKTVYKLKVKQDLHSLKQKVEFLFEHHRKVNNILQKDTVKFGIAVLPDNHELRDVLLNLCEALPVLIRQTVSDFMGTTYYTINKRDDDRLFAALVNDHRDLFMSMIAGSDAEPFFTSWLADGMPEFSNRIQRWSLPFCLLPDGDALRAEYQSDRNIRQTSMRKIYDELSEKGYPILGSFLWGSTDKKLVKDLILYLQEKNKVIVQIKKDGN